MIKRYYNTKNITGEQSILEIDKIKKVSSRTKFIPEYCANKKVLTIGCVDMIDTISIDELIDSGNHQFYNLNKLCKKAVGIDINQDGIDKLVDLGLEVYNYDIFSNDKNPVENYEFDIIILSHVIEHIPNFYEFIKIVKEKFKFKEIIIAVPNAYNGGTIFNLIFGKKEIISNDHYYTFTPTTIIKIMESLDIEIKELFLDRDEIKLQLGQNKKILGLLKNIVLKYVYKHDGDLICIGNFK